MLSNREMNDLMDNGPTILDSASPQEVASIELKNRLNGFSSKSKWAKAFWCLFTT